MIFNAAQFQTLTDCPPCAVDMLENIELKETVYLDLARACMGTSLSQRQS